VSERNQDYVLTLNEYHIIYSKHYIHHAVVGRFDSVGLPRVFMLSSAFTSLFGQSSFRFVTSPSVCVIVFLSVSSSVDYTLHPPSVCVIALRSVSLLFAVCPISLRPVYSLFFRFFRLRPTWHHNKKIFKMKKFTLLCLLLTTALLALAADENTTPTEEEGETKPSKVVVLTKDNWSEKVHLGVSFVKFYAPWCGHCKHLAPIWSDYAEEAIKGSEDKEGIIVGKVDCTIEKIICKRYNVYGYPTLKVFNGMFV